MTFSPRRSETGELDGARIFVRNLSATLRMQETLEFVLESAAVGFWDVDIATGVSARSRTHDQLYGHAQAVP